MLINLLAEEATAYNYIEFFIILGVVLGLVLISTIVLIWHSSYLKKKDKHIGNTPTADSNNE